MFREVSSDGADLYLIIKVRAGWLHIKNMRNKNTVKLGFAGLDHLTIFTRSLHAMLIGNPKLGSRTIEQHVEGIMADPKTAEALAILVGQEAV